MISNSFKETKTIEELEKIYSHLMNEDEKALPMLIRGRKEPSNELGVNIQEPKVVLPTPFNYKKVNAKAKYEFNHEFNVIIK